MALFLETICGQGFLVSGTVVDSQGVSLPGVTVSEQDTSNGVVTDLDGNYILTVSSANATLIFISLSNALSCSSLFLISLVDWFKETNFSRVSLL